MRMTIRRARVRARPVRRSSAARAEAAGWRLDKPTRLFLDDLDAALAGAPGGKVAVLTDPDRPSGLTDLLETHPSVDAVHTFDADDDRLHLDLTAAGWFDVVVDDTRPRRGHATLVRHTFGHVRKGGTYLVRHAHSRRRNDVADLFGALAANCIAGPPHRREASADRRMAATIGCVTVRGHHALATAKVNVRVKVRETEMNDLLDQSGSTLGRVNATLPAATLHSRATINQSPSEYATAVAQTYRAPALSLRTYRDVVCSPGQVVWRDNVILPDSFRHNMRPLLTNKMLRQAGPGFAATPSPARPTERLAGAYFHLDNEVRGHYGHAMTEQLSRLWAWREAKADDPSLKALMLIRNRELAPFEPILYAAAGIDPTDLVVLDRAVRVDQLVSATPMFSQPQYVHPDLPAVWDQVSANLAGQAPDRDYPRRFFCSRRPRKRDCTNGADVEALFAAHGFTVLYPEDYPLTEQARMFQEADVIAGYAGSAMISTVMCGGPKHVIVVASESYEAKNEQLIAAAAGHRLDIAWCKAERERVPGRFRRRVSHSPFTFDEAREGAWLRGILADLD